MLSLDLQDGFVIPVVGNWLRYIWYLVQLMPTVQPIRLSDGHVYGLTHNEKRDGLFRLAASLDVQNVQATSPQIYMIPRYVEYFKESFAIYVRALTG